MPDEQSVTVSLQTLLWALFASKRLRPYDILSSWTTVVSLPWVAACFSTRLPQHHLLKSVTLYAPPSSSFFHLHAQWVAIPRLMPRFTRPPPSRFTLYLPHFSIIFSKRNERPSIDFIVIFKPSQLARIQGPPRRFSAVARQNRNCSCEGIPEPLPPLKKPTIHHSTSSEIFFISHITRANGLNFIESSIMLLLLFIRS